MERLFGLISKLLSFSGPIITVSQCDSKYFVALKQLQVFNTEIASVVLQATADGRVSPQKVIRD